MRAVARMLPDGRRLHLQDGPIDLAVEAVPFAPINFPRHAEERCTAARLEARTTVLRAPKRAFGSSHHDAGEEAVAVAYRAATLRFATILDELCAELAGLRSPARTGRRFASPIAARMQEAVAPFAPDTFITPMAAVAGSVAEEVLAAMIAAAPLARASVNNGGDIALHLAPGESVRVGLVDRPDRPSLFGSATIRSIEPVRGIATSGWRGRSFSLGIADAVTILADTAAAADAAATIVANAVDLPGHPAVTRAPAREVQCDSDLGGRLVTRGVGALRPSEIDEALSRGRACAERLIARGLIRGAALHLQSITKLAGPSGGPLSRAGEGQGEGGALTGNATPLTPALSLWERESGRASRALLAAEASA